MSSKKGFPERTYTATADELNEAIKVVMKEKPNAEYKEVRSILMRRKKDWKLPERRIAKFVKRQRMGQPINADDEESIVNSVGPVRSMFQKMGKSNKKTADTSSAKPTPAPAKPVVVEPAPPEAAPEPVIVQEKSVIPDSAVDDNDGAKEPSLCAGCVVM